MDFQKQSVLAKLLARENITVQHGNYHTAYFDVENRVLGLPLWKDKGKDVYDLLVGHEVGHALFTPSEGWHDSTIDVEGIPRSFLNVVEDIRIERMIQAKYPGLVASFKRGYSVLDKDDFFGIEGKDVSTLGLMDRINLKAKLRDLIEVSYTSEEQPYVDMAFNATTWDDVVAAARALFEYLKGKKDENAEQDHNQTVPGQDPADPTESDSLDSNANTESTNDDVDGNSDESRDGDSEGEDQSTQEVGAASSNKDDDVEKEKEKVESAVRKDDQDRTNDESDPTRVTTDENFRAREDELLDTNDGYQPQYLRQLTRQQLNDIVVQIDDILPARREMYTYISKLIHMRDDEESQIEFGYKAFNTETKRFVNLMAKEFEMRKAAYQTQRAQTARSGSLNVDKLYNYKFADDIFKRVTNLADAKSHGMVMVIDYSGSMGDVIGDVIKQTLVLASFCKKVNIPFDVYSFTSASGDRQMTAPQFGQVDHTGVTMCHLLSSTFKKQTYEEAYFGLFKQASVRGDYYRSQLYRSKFENMGGTPLNETIMAVEILADDFKKKYNLQKTTVVFLTDGAANNVYYARDPHATVNTKGYAIQMREAVVKANTSRKITRNLLSYMRKKHTMIGYFLAARTYDFRGAVWDAADSFVDDSQMNEYRKRYNKDKFVSFDNALGYDKFFVLKSSSGTLNTDEDEFEVSENAKKGEITRAFKKFAGSKKTNRVFATQFAQVIA